MTNDVEKMVYGFALFDNTQLPKEGFASIAGRKPRRIESIGDLDSDIIWISNLNFNESFDANINRSPKMRRNDFLRVPIQRLAREIGVNLVDNPEHGVALISEAINRLMTKASQVYGFYRPEDTLRNTLEKILLNKNSDFENQTVAQQALNNAFQSFQPCYGNIPQGVQNVQFRWSRTHFANTILRMPYPKGEWSVYQGRLPEKNKDRGKSSDMYDFLEDLGNSQPALCKIKVANISPEVDELLDFTYGTECREWMPIHEVIKLAEYAVVNIKNILVCEKYTTAKEEGLDLPDEGPVSDLSLSYGLLAENMWLSISSKQKTLRAGRHTEWVSARAVWLRAWDRVICLDAALEFKSQNFHVSSYGLGSVNLLVWPELFGGAIDTALSLKMSPPIWLLDDADMQIEEAEKELELKIKNRESSERL
jgi:hypothetical protein